MAMTSVPMTWVAMTMAVRVVVSLHVMERIALRAPVDASAGRKNVDLSLAHPDTFAADAKRGHGAA